MRLTDQDLPNIRVFYSPDHSRDMFTTQREAEEEARSYDERTIIKFVKNRQGNWNDEKYITI